VARVRLSAFGSVGQEVGWATREIEVEPGTVADVLRAIETSDGRSLLELLAEGDRVKPAYALLLNGINVEDAEGLSTKVREQDQIAALDVIRISAGG
jgi:molybdopterin converting factor small subunit